MDGAERAFATPVEATFCGKTYKMRGQMAGHFGEISRKILSLRPDPIALGRRAYLAHDGDPVAQEMQARVYADMAMQLQNVTKQEVFHFVNYTVEGLAFVLYLALRDDQPDMTEDEALMIMLRDQEERALKLIAAGEEEDEARMKALMESTQYIDSKVNEAGGGDWRGNSIGSSSIAEGTSQKTENPASTGD